MQSACPNTAHDPVDKTVDRNLQFSGEIAGFPLANQMPILINALSLSFS
jgi:hypothetical protein